MSDLGDCRKLFRERGIRVVVDGPATEYARVFPPDVDIVGTIGSKDGLISALVQLPNGEFARINNGVMSFVTNEDEFREIERGFIEAGKAPVYAMKKPAKKERRCGNDTCLLGLLECQMLALKGKPLVCGRKDLLMKPA